MTNDPQGPQAIIRPSGRHNLSLDMERTSPGKRLQGVKDQVYEEMLQYFPVAGNQGLSVGIGDLEVNLAVVVAYFLMPDDLPQEIVDVEFLTGYP